jgi:hypothetical protein
MPFSIISEIEKNIDGRYPYNQSIAEILPYIPNKAYSLTWYKNRHILIQI